MNSICVEVSYPYVMKFKTSRLFKISSDCSMKVFQEMILDDFWQEIATFKKAKIKPHGGPSLVGVFVNNVEIQTEEQFREHLLRKRFFEVIFKANHG